jgi:thymidylate kinase
MIVKLHGTSGSGKTTVARGLMELAKKEFGVTAILNTREKPEAYMFQLPGVEGPVFVLGPYINAIGGLDCVGDSKDHIRLLHSAASHGHVFYEGLLGSEYYGEIGRQSERYGDSHIFAFLDTPVDVCVERVKARRAAAGNKKLFNESNTRGRIAKIARLKFRLEHELRRKVVTIDHTNAVQQVYNLYRGINGHGSSST